MNLSGKPRTRKGFPSLSRVPEDNAVGPAEVEESDVPDEKQKELRVAVLFDSNDLGNKQNDDNADKKRR